MKAQVQWWRDVGGGTVPQNPLLVVVVADDDTAVSALPAGHGAQWWERTQARETATARVAAHLGVTVFLAGSGELPEGHDLLLLGEVGRGMTTLAARVAVTELLAEPQLVVGHGSGISDVQWMQKVADVRDRQTDGVPDPIRELAGIVRDCHVPILLDGVACAAAMALAETMPSVQIPVLGAEPAQRLFAERLDIPVWGSSGIGPGEGLGALTGLAMLRLALLAQ